VGALGGLRLFISEVGFFCPIGMPCSIARAGVFDQDGIVGVCPTR
jgi:hypothetical protein